jgi:hypothetical protein
MKNECIASKGVTAIELSMLDSFVKRANGWKQDGQVDVPQPSDVKLALLMHVCVPLL